MADTSLTGEISTAVTINIVHNLVIGLDGEISTESINGEIL